MRRAVWGVVCAGVIAASAQAADLRVRATEIVAPCVRSAGAQYLTLSGQRVLIETGPVRHPGPVDVVVGSDVEMTRALEGGDAVIGSEEALARIPWVIVQAPSSGPKISSLAELGRGAEVTLMGGPAAYEARRALSARGVKLREATDPAQLKAAPVAVVPLSLAGSGSHLATDIPPIPVSAAVVEGAVGDGGSKFIHFLISPKGQSAFSSCAAP
jgi:hypothetical protein